MGNPFDDIIQFYRALQMEDQTEMDNARDRLARIVYEKPDLSPDQKQFFSQFLPLIGDRILDEFSSKTLQEAFEKLLDGVVRNIQK